MSTNDFFKSVYAHPLLRPEDYFVLSQFHERVEFSAGSMLLQKGKTAQAFHVIEHGLVRSFLRDYNGNEVTTGFYCPGEIQIESFSLFHRQPSKENFQALSACVAWKIDYVSFLPLLQQLEGLREWGRNWATSQLLACKLHAIEGLTMPAAERYVKLIETRPEIARASPLKYIASYLGITDSSLSRIRKEISSR